MSQSIPRKSSASANEAIAMATKSSTARIMELDVIVTNLIFGYVFDGELVVWNVNSELMMEK